MTEQRRWVLQIQRRGVAGDSEESGEDGGAHTRVELLPTLDVRGHLYDTGQGKDNDMTLPGNRKKNEKV